VPMLHFEDALNGIPIARVSCHTHYQTSTERMIKLVTMVSSCWFVATITETALLVQCNFAKSINKAKVENKEQFLL